ncbi:MAG: indole-3-glycerol phosphate synthase TrpC [Candidatus Omnitrophota bacterium]
MEKYRFRTVLDKILESKRNEIEARKKSAPLPLLKQQLGQRHALRNFKKSLEGGRIQLIGEIKRSSPSRGVLREDFEPVALAAIYQRGGAASLSVLTDEPFFGGHLSYIQRIKSAVTLPVLRKDFILEEYQLYESAAAGSDAVLLIGSILTETLLSRLMKQAEALGMASLVEVHSEADLEKALASGAEMIGINNRDLRTFQVDFRTSERLAAKIPKGKVIVSESGIHSRQEVERLEALGFHAVLIGQAFMERPDMEEAIHEIMGR